MRIERAGEPGERATECERLHLEFEHVLAGKGCDLRILADRTQRATERGRAHTLQNEKHYGEDDETEQEIDRIEIRTEDRLQRLRNAGDSIGAAREPNLILGDSAHDFGEAERDDREIVVAQPSQAE